MTQYLLLFQISGVVAHVQNNINHHNAMSRHNCSSIVCLFVCCYVTTVLRGDYMIYDDNDAMVEWSAI